MTTKVTKNTKIGYGAELRWEPVRVFECGAYYGLSRSPGLVLELWLPCRQLSISGTLVEYPPARALALWVMVGPVQDPTLFVPLVLSPSFDQISHFERNPLREIQIVGH